MAKVLQQDNLVDVNQIESKLQNMYLGPRLGAVRKNTVHSNFTTNQREPVPHIHTSSYPTVNTSRDYGYPNCQGNPYINVGRSMMPNPTLATSLGPREMVALGDSIGQAL